MIEPRAQGRENAKGECIPHKELTGKKKEVSPPFTAEGFLSIGIKELLQGPKDDKADSDRIKQVIKTSP